MKMLKTVTACLLILAFCASVCACSRVPYGLEESLDRLIRDGHEMSLVIYGEGLKTDAERGKIGSVYEAVAADEKYQSVKEMKSAMSEIFTGEYVAVLSVTAFDGVNYEGSLVRKRYVDHEDGILYADISYETQVIVRTPDYESIEIVQANKYMAEVKVDMIDEETDEVSEQTFIVRYLDNKWKLDGCVL